MCCGAWFGAAWAFGGFGLEGVVWGLFGGSYVAALGVALWLAVAESQAALALWRYVATPLDEQKE